jgi:hypothetical protein
LVLGTERELEAADADADSEPLDYTVEDDSESVVGAQVQTPARRVITLIPRREFTKIRFDYVNITYIY